MSLRFAESQLVDDRYGRCAVAPTVPGCVGSPINCKLSLARLRRLAEGPAHRYTIVAGHRRFAAMRRCAAEDPSNARWRSVDVVVRHIDKDEALALMLVENLQRKAFSPLEEAIALQRLRVVRGWTQQTRGTSSPQIRDVRVAPTPCAGRHCLERCCSCRPSGDHNGRGAPCS